MKMNGQKILHALDIYICTAFFLQPTRISARPATFVKLLYNVMSLLLDTDATISTESPTVTLLLGLQQLTSFEIANNDMTTGNSSSAQVTSMLNGTLVASYSLLMSQTYSSYAGHGELSTGTCKKGILLGAMVFIATFTGTLI